MTDDDPITLWVAGLKANELAAAEKLWERYCQRIRGLARKVLIGGDQNSAEDVAQSVFRSFFVRATNGRFPKLDDRNDLWGLLTTITIRKAGKKKRKAARDPLPVGDVELITAQFADEPSPEFVVDVKDEVRHLLSLLGPAEKRIAHLIMEGRTTEEISVECDLSRATIERKRKLIRETWLREMRQ